MSLNKVHQPNSHFVIPDTQIKAGVPTKQLEWVGHYIVDRKPDVIIHLGDHWDMPSLSSYDRGKIQFEGRRYAEDISAGNAAFQLLTNPLKEYNKGKSAKNRYKPRLVFLLGNHEDRISRAVEDYPVMEGKISLSDLDTGDWEVHNFLEPVTINGVVYAHYFYNPMTGRPYGGQVATRLKTIGHSFTMGHQQTLDYALRFVGGRSQHGLVAGACYLHDEDYRGPQGNAHWRGIVICHGVDEGSYNPMMVDLDYLCRKYENMPLAKFIKKRSGDKPVHVKVKVLT